MIRQGNMFLNLHTAKLNTRTIQEMCYFGAGATMHANPYFGMTMTKGFGTL